MKENISNFFTAMANWYHCHLLYTYEVSPQYDAACAPQACTAL